MHTTRLIPLAAFAVLVLTACDPAPAVTITVPADPSVTPSAAPVVSPVVTPSPTFVAHPAPVDLRITTSGLLPLTIGMDAATNPGAAMIQWDPTYCYSVEMDITTNTGRWSAAYPSGLFSLNGHYAPAITRIDIWDPVLQTPEGIHVGSTLVDLVAAYPGLVTGTPAFSTTPYWISDAAGIVVFEVGNGTVMGDPGPDQVWFIRVLSAGSDPDYAIASSGNIADACF
ncbi:MAG: hypothetical protein JW722_02520 [Demequinaceae bacterium]|nr:hypothetical protein [Demequinaceae bacterium]